MSSQRPAPPIVSCIYCGDEIVIPGAILPTGASVCADCADGGAAHLAPTSEKPEEGLVPEISPAEAIVPGDPHVPDGDVTWNAKPVEVASAGCNFTGCVRVKGHGSFHTTIQGVAKHQDAREASEEAMLHPRAFHPEAGAQELAIEVEEWIWADGFVTPLATPNELYCAVVARLKEDKEDLPEACLSRRFVVVLEWCRDGGPTRRDIGPNFDAGESGQLARTAALAAATAFARAEAKRLKACGPYGYRPARAIPEI